MLRHLNENAPLKLKCPRCGTPFTKTPKQMKTTPRFSCSKCGTVFDAKNLAAGFEKADKMVGDFGKNASRMAK